MNTTGSPPVSNSPENSNLTHNQPTTSSSPQIQQPITKPNDVSTKKVTITSPTTITKPSQSHVAFANPSESGKSNSSFSQSKITLRTCCGVVELTSMKLACLLGMLVTVIGLLVLAGISIAAFITANSKSTDILINVGRVTALFESSNAMIMKYVYTADRGNFQTLNVKYKNSSSEMKETLLGILQNLDESEVKQMFNSTSIEATNAWINQNNQILYMVQGNQPQDGVDRLNSAGYNEIVVTFKEGLDRLVTYIQNKEKDKDQQVLATTLVQLIVIVISLFVVLPIIVFVFTYAINRDTLYLEKIRRANAIMLMDTMEDDGLRALFKIHCEKEKSTENYLLLEKIQYYRTLCERSLDLQMRLYGDINNPNSDAISDISAESSTSSKKKKESPLEREYVEIEAKKYEVAFEIFTEFLEVTGDMAVNISSALTDSVKDKLDKFNDKQLETLPEDMFNIVEKETCLVMMDTHHRFKQSLAFQREMKIDKIKVDKLKKKKPVEF